MITRQRIVSYGIPTAAAATIVAAALLTHGSSDTHSLVGEVPTPVNGTIPSYSTTGKHQIDVVFAVDTTGSMGGLLQGAKQTVWSIASHIRKTDPNADLRIGLVAYRDVGDEYVTRPFQLSGDLDAVFAELSTYQPAGGGDTPEDVDAAIDDGLKMQWRKGAKKLMFVVGDAPPASRGEVPKYDDLAEQAAERGIIINTIRCGWDTDTEQAFSRLARLGKGSFSTIHQDGGVQQVATPYDDKIAELSTEIDRTAVIVGDDSTRERWEGKMAAASAAPAPAKADRASYYGKGGGMKRAEEDLVGGVATGSMDLDKVDQGSLPADMRGKDKAEVKAEIEARVAKRKELQKKVDELTKQRDEYLAKEAKSGEGGFDTAVKSTVEAQLK
ncbi:MAG TPA: VWA domain-containing protein [Kofleriaceae bacterium]|nr:VWA domain-containing protein [Kofleriaceae bacterium]